MRSASQAVRVLILYDIVVAVGLHRRVEVFTHKFAGNVFGWRVPRLCQVLILGIFVSAKFVLWFGFHARGHRVTGSVFDLIQNTPAQIREAVHKAVWHMRPESLGVDTRMSIDGYGSR